MKKKKEFFIYTAMWIIAILVLLIPLCQNIGDARIINYSGIVRGATQKLVKEELNGIPDDDLILQLDNIIYSLQTGKGEYDLSKTSNKDYQQRLGELKSVWEDMKEEILQMRNGKEDGNALFEMSQQHFEIADGMVLSAELDSDGKLKRFAVLYFISLAVSVAIFAVLNRKSHRDLEKSKDTDNLTGILNRKGFEEAAEALLSRNREKQYTIVEFDVDNFKAVNNTHGYVFGDRLLQALASALSRHYTDGQLCARIDADDFVLLSRHSDTAVDEMLKVLYEVLEEQLPIEAFGRVTFSVGAYHIEQNGDDVKNIVDKANIAHKTAKAGGISQIVWYDQKLLNRLNLENYLNDHKYKALENGQFKLYLQPKVDLVSGKISGAESLVRLELPDYGTLYPDSFIPFYEKIGFIAELDFYMLNRTCEYLQRHLETGLPPFTISVNFSRVTFYHRTFYDTFLEIADRYQVPYGCIEIEVTESFFNEVDDSVIQLLSRLKDTGFLISMDDFGSGYSSLNMLSKLPIQIIKLDREFLKEMELNDSVRGVITWAVSLAHVLKTKIICEGVELPEQVDFLQNIGCDYGQGYYWSKPIPQEEFALRLKAENGYLQFERDKKHVVL